MTVPDDIKDMLDNLMDATQSSISEQNKWTCKQFMQLTDDVNSSFNKLINNINSSFEYVYKRLDSIDEKLTKLENKSEQTSSEIHYIKNDTKLIPSMLGMHKIEAEEFEGIRQRVDKLESVSKK